MTIFSTARFAALAMLAAGSLQAFGQTPEAPEAPEAAILNLQTKFAAFAIDNRGMIVSLTSLGSGKQYSPAGHPSPVLSLHEFGKPYSQLLFPVSAAYDQGRQQIEFKFPNGAVATVKAAAKDAYIRFQLAALTPRGDVDNIVWGPLNTTISKKIGDIIGVVRDDDWAIGMWGLDDNTISGPPTESDCRSMGYYVHSPDPAKYPLPSQYHEGQELGVGGNGISDVAFYSKPEEYFQQHLGTGASLEPEFGSSVAYHSRDRQRPYTYLFSLLPGFPRSRPRHQVADAVPGVDFMGSAVAVYACPDDEGLHTIESIILAEGLPHPTFGGKWIRDPASHQPDLFWRGPVDKEIEYAKALGLMHLSRDTGEFFMNRDATHNFAGIWHGKVGYADGHSVSYKEFGELAAKNGMDHGGLHTLTMFLQGGISDDVNPVPNPHLQTVCRTKLAKDISATDTEIEVTDPSYLGEKGTWTEGDDSNYLVVGGEMMRYSEVTSTPPYIVKIAQRGHGSKAVPHKAGDELVKLQQNCYNGFVPDITMVPECADYYARLMAENGMTTIGFDGLESTIYQNQGYYGVRVFFHRLFDTYAKLTGGKFPRMLPSSIFPGAWDYDQSCNCGGGAHMFDAAGNHWGIEGKDFRNAFRNSYYPATFGLQGFHSNWSLYDIENLEAKSVGWDATYGFVMSEAEVEASGEKEDFFKAFHAWEAARAASAFTKAQLEELQDMTMKFHLEQTGEKSFVLYPIKEVSVVDNAGNDGKTVTVSNGQQSQPLQFALRIDGPADGCTVTLPSGAKIESTAAMTQGQFIVCKGNQAYVADKCRKKIADLPMPGAASLTQGDSTVGVQFKLQGAKKVRFDLTVWISGKGERIGI